LLPNQVCNQPKVSPAQVISSSMGRVTQLLLSYRPYTYENP
jgi:hypothetical protein